VLKISHLYGFNACPVAAADDGSMTPGAKAAAMHNARNHEILKTISPAYLLGMPRGDHLKMLPWYARFE
jgi:hypothetical protein